MKATGVKKGSSNPKVERVAEITKEKIREIAELKKPDLNAYDIESAMRIIEGTARSAGITVID
jgi:large subunit ribosomal protein L11